MTSPTVCIDLGLGLGPLFFFLFFLIFAFPLYRKQSVTITTWVLTSMEVERASFFHEAIKQNEGRPLASDTIQELIKT